MVGYGWPDNQRQAEWYHSDKNVHLLVNSLNDSQIKLGEEPPNIK